MDESSWDIFSAQSQPESLWFAYRIAKGLADRGRRVRLFSDQIDELAVALPEIDRGLWIQPHQDFEIVDRRVAPISVVARHVVEVFDAQIPPAYLNRVECGQAASCNVQIVSQASEREPTNPVTVLEKVGNCTSFLAQIGDLPRRAGYVKSGRRGTMLRQLWRTPDVRKGMFTALDVPEDIADQKLGVYFDARGSGALVPWVRHWAKSPQEICVFVEKDKLTSEPELLSGAKADPHGILRLDAVTIVPLPPRRWFLTDELIWASDVVMTSQSDVAARATESGTPLIWGADDDGSIFDWYASGTPEVTRRTVADAFDALASGKNVPWAWNCFTARWDELQSLAGQVSNRIMRAPDIVDVLLAGIADSQREGVGRLFAPTMPGGVFQA